MYEYEMSTSLGMFVWLAIIPALIAVTIVPAFMVATRKSQNLYLFLLVLSLNVCVSLVLLDQDPWWILYLQYIVPLQLFGLCGLLARAYAADGRERLSGVYAKLRVAPLFVIGSILISWVIFGALS